MDVIEEVARAMRPHHGFLYRTEDELFEARARAAIRATLQHLIEVAENMPIDIENQPQNIPAEIWADLEPLFRDDLRVFTAGFLSQVLARLDA